MAEVTRLNTQLLPGPSESEQFELLTQGVADLFYTMQNRNLKLTEILEAIAEVNIALTRREVLKRYLAEQQRPASKKELADRLSALRIAFPNAKAAGDGFSRILIERVASKRPSIGALDWSIRRMIDHSKYLPEISDMLTALANAQDRIVTAVKYLNDLPQLQREFEALIPEAEREEASEREAQERKRALLETTKAACREILGDDSDEIMQSLPYSVDAATLARLKLLRDQLMQKRSRAPP